MILFWCWCLYSDTKKCRKLCKEHKVKANKVKRKKWRSKNKEVHNKKNSERLKNNRERANKYKREYRKKEKEKQVNSKKSLEVVSATTNTKSRNNKVFFDHKRYKKEHSYIKYRLC